MATDNEKFSVLLKGRNDIVDITFKIKGIVRNSDIDKGLVNIYANSPYLSVIISNNEFKNKNIINLLNSISPIKIELDSEKEQIGFYEYSDIKTAILGNSVSIPIVNKQLEISDTQHILLIDFSISESMHDVIVSLIH